MAKICSWCGEQIGFTDMTYTCWPVGEKMHCVCSKCSGKISCAKNGHITFKEIATEKTVPELLNHFAKQVENSEEMIQAKKLKQEQQQIKEAAQQTNPLYDDIHQIARDLRFIKNYLIFCIVVGIIWGLIYLASML